MLPAEQLHILQHSLGVDQYGRGRRYRNYYVSPPNADLIALVEAGLMIDHGTRGELTGGMNVFEVTTLGLSTMLRESPQPPKLSRSQRRYREWLDADCGIPFGEWLRKGYGKQGWTPEALERLLADVTGAR